jgi:uncharacterized protein (TIGR02271 family)
MGKRDAKRVVGEGGWHGTVVRVPSARSRDQTALIRLDNGREVLVPADMLAKQRDGTYLLPLALNDLQAPPDRATIGAAEPLVVPVVEEELFLDKRTVETGVVRVRKVVHEREELVDEPLLGEEIRVERVPVNRVLDRPVDIRQEGDTTIIPVYEEVLVVEKRLILKEEIHISKRKIDVRQPQQVTTRSEEVVVEREVRESER